MVVEAEQRARDVTDVGLLKLADRLARHHLVICTGDVGTLLAARPGVLQVAFQRDPDRHWHLHLVVLFREECEPVGCRGLALREVQRYAPAALWNRHRAHLPKHRTLLELALQPELRWGRRVVHLLERRDRERDVGAARPKAVKRAQY